MWSIVLLNITTFPFLVTQKRSNFASFLQITTSPHNNALTLLICLIYTHHFYSPIQPTSHSENPYSSVPIILRFQFLLKAQFCGLNFGLPYVVWIVSKTIFTTQKQHKMAETGSFHCDLGVRTTGKDIGIGWRKWKTLGHMLNQVTRMLIPMFELSMT